MILPYQTIKDLCIHPRLPLVSPFSERGQAFGMTFGCGRAGYDVRIAEDVSLIPRADGGRAFYLASTIEKFNIPDDILANVCDKSTWARSGLFVQNTVIEPGWSGFLALEITYEGDDQWFIAAGSPIAQIVFSRLEAPTDRPYDGKYQDQLPGPQLPLFDRLKDDDAAG